MKQTITIALIITGFIVNAQNNIMAQKGYDDSQYFRTGGVFASTFISTLLFTPVVGVSVATVLSATPPKTQNMLIKSDSLCKNYDYMYGYRFGAAKKKRGAAWGGFALGIGVNVATVLLIVSVK